MLGPASAMRKPRARGTSDWGHHLVLRGHDGARDHCGALFGSVALVADGLYMSTHAGVLPLAPLAYGYARHHAADPRFHEQDLAWPFACPAHI